MKISVEMSWNATSRKNNNNNNIEKTRTDREMGEKNKHNTVTRYTSLKMTRFYRADMIRLLCNTLNSIVPYFKVDNFAW